MKAAFAKKRNPEKWESKPKKEIEVTSDKMRMDISSGKICPYCGKPSARVLLSDIYNTTTGDKEMAYCESCNAMTTINTYTEKPNGRLADHALRTLRKEIYSLRENLFESVAYSFLNSNADTIFEALPTGSPAGSPGKTGQITDLNYEEAVIVHKFLQEIDNL